MQWRHRGWVTVLACAAAGCTGTGGDVARGASDGGRDSASTVEAGSAPAPDATAADAHASPDAKLDASAEDAASGPDAATDDAGHPDGPLDAGLHAAEAAAVDAFAAEAYAVICAWNTSCRQYGACEALPPAIEFRILWQGAREAAAHGDIALDPAAAATCLAAARAPGCQTPAVMFVADDRDGYDWPWSVPCLHLVRGLLPVGSACAPELGIGEECANGYCGGSGCPGVCAPFLPLGASCARGRECGPDAACRLDGDAGGLHCVSRGVEGGGCTRMSDCRDGLLCSSDSEGQCEPPAEAGGPCVGNLQCPGGFACDRGLCVTVSQPGGACKDSSNCPNGQTCTDTGCADPPVPGDRGASCTGDQECASGLLCFDASTAGHCDAPHPPGGACNQTHDCEAGSFCNGATCEKQAVSGAACNVQNFLDSCQSGLRCMGNGICSAPGDAGTPCRFGDRTTCAPGFNCDGQDETCVPPAKLGELCDPGGNAPCAPGSTCLCGDAECTSYVTPPTPGGPVCAHASRVLGQPCRYGDECESAACGGGQCIPAGDFFSTEDPACVGTGPLIGPAVRAAP